MTSAAEAKQLGTVHPFPAPQEDPAALLAEARAAYKVKLNAEFTINRLQKYSGMNRSMKRDHGDAYSRLTSADATLRRILGPSLNR